MPALESGASLKQGRFIIESLLASGGFGEVYLATQPAMHRQVAIKVLRPEVATNERVLSLFEREARAAGGLFHPHVLPVIDFDFDEVRGVHFLAMQYVPGARTLNDRLGAPLDPSEVASTVEAIASALDAAHALGIVHRDVKPANVLLDQAGRPLLSDFGIAHLDESTVSATTTRLGTALYMAPERWRGEPADARADQYALAVMAYEMLAGRPPFVGDEVALLGQHLTTSPPLLTDFNPRIDPAVDAPVRRALSKDKAQRFSSCGELALALRLAVQTEPARTTPIPGMTSESGYPPLATPRPPIVDPIRLADDVRQGTRPAPQAVTVPMHVLWAGAAIVGFLIFVLGVVMLTRFMDSREPSLVVVDATPSAAPLPMAAAPLSGSPVAASGSSTSATAPSPTLVPASGTAVVLSDTFDRAASGILSGASNDGQVAKGYVDGEYHIQVLDANYRSMAYTRLPGTHTDTTMSVTVRLVGSFASPAVTLGCREQTDAQSEYRLAVWPDSGSFQLVRQEETGPVDLVAYRQSDAIRRGAQRNLIELTCVGGTIQGSINGVRVATAEDSTYQTGSLFFGVSPGGAPAQVYFDDLVVTRAGPVLELPMVPTRSIRPS